MMRAGSCARCIGEVLFGSPERKAAGLRHACRDEMIFVSGSVGVGAVQGPRGGSCGRPPNPQAAWLLMSPANPFLDAVRVVASEGPGNMGAGALVRAQSAPSAMISTGLSAPRRAPSFQPCDDFPGGVQKRLIARVIFPGKHGGGCASRAGGVSSVSHLDRRRRARCGCVLGLCNQRVKTITSWDSGVGGGSTSRILLMSRLIIADDMEAGVRVGVAVGLDVVGARRSLHNVNLDSTACRRQLAAERLPTTHSQAMIQCDDGSWMHNVAVRASVHSIVPRAVQV